MWHNLQHDILQLFSAFALSPSDQFAGLTKSFDLKNKRKVQRDAERWKNTKCDAEKHAKRKEQNKRAAKKYLAKPGKRAEHNARMRRRYARQRN